MTVARILVMGLMALALVSGCRRASGNPPAQQATEHLWRLQADLASQDPVTRQRAEAELDRVPVAYLEALRKLADTAGDPEVQARFLARADALFELQLTDPPSIALDIQNADVTQLAAALSKATGWTFAAEPGAFAYARFTLKADASLWELRRRLSEGFPIGIGAHDLTGSIWPDFQPQMQSVIVRGFEIRAGELNWGVTGVRPVDATTRDDLFLVPQITGLMELNVDPRIRVAQVGSPAFARLMDDQENGWVNHTIEREYGPRIGQITFTQGIAFRPWDQHGATLTIIGKWPVDILLAAQHAEVTDFSRPPPQPIRLGDVEIQFTRLELSPVDDGLHGVHLRLAYKHLNMSLGPAMSVGIGVFSRDGTPMGSVSTSSQDGALSAGIDRLPEVPAKIVLTVPTRTQRVWIPFEFRDLPITGEYSPPQRLPRR